VITALLFLLAVAFVGAAWRFVLKGLVVAAVACAALLLGLWGWNALITDPAAVRTQAVSCAAYRQSHPDADPFPAVNGTLSLQQFTSPFFGLKH